MAWEAVAISHGAMIRDRPPDGSEEGMDPFSSGTPLLSYAQFQNALRIEFGRARRYGLPLSCLAVGLDGLEPLRDKHGGAVRDEAFAFLVAAIQTHLRGSDLLGHYNDRLALLLPHAGMEGACAVSERILAQVAMQPFHLAGESVSLTASIGVASLESRSTIFFDSLAKSAEAAAQQAAAAGGGRIVRASALPVKA